MQAQQPLVLGPGRLGQVAPAVEPFRAYSPKSSLPRLGSTQVPRPASVCWPASQALASALVAKVTCAVTQRPPDWYRARYLLPLFSMLPKMRRAMARQ